MDANNRNTVPGPNYDLALEGRLIDRHEGVDSLLQCDSVRAVEILLQGASKDSHHVSVIGTKTCFAKCDAEKRVESDLLHQKLWFLDINLRFQLEHEVLAIR